MRNFILSLISLSSLALLTSCAYMTTEESDAALTHLTGVCRELYVNSRTSVTPSGFGYQYHRYKPRAFAIGKSKGECVAFYYVGSWGVSEAVVSQNAIEGCQRIADNGRCELFAVDDRIVYRSLTPSSQYSASFRKDEAEILRNRLEEQRVQQEQALADAQAQVDAEIARIKAEAEASKSQPTTALPNFNYAKINEAHALVIGNSAYPGSAKLTNPRNDAKAISAKLRSLGFKVTEVIDASRAQMVRSLSKFSEASEKADVTLLFYAGHGVQISGINYMIPVDTNLSDISEATLQAISLNSVVERYLPGKTKLVFLDACRDNPLMTASSRGVTRGLAPINVSEGTLISYATKDGQTAADGTGQKNSPYTAALLENLGDPQDIGIVMRTVRAKVMQRTDNRQQPWEYGSLTGGALVLTTIKK